MRRTSPDPFSLPIRFSQTRTKKLGADIVVPFKLNNPKKVFSDRSLQTVEYLVNSTKCPYSGPSGPQPDPLSHRMS